MGKFQTYINKSAAAFKIAVFLPQDPWDKKVCCVYSKHPSFRIHWDTGNSRKMHRLMEKKIGGVRYKVYSSFDGDTGFRELYEKSLAARLIKLHAQGCAGDAAGS